MAISARTVKARLTATIKAISFTDPNEGFTDANEQGPISGQPAVSGNKREFYVVHAEGEVGAFTHPADSEVVETFGVAVFYPDEGDMLELDSQIRDDVKAIRVALDDKPNWGDDVIHQQLKTWKMPGLSDSGKRTLVLAVEVNFLESNT